MAKKRRAKRKRPAGSRENALERIHNHFEHSNALQEQYASAQSKDEKLRFLARYAAKTPRRSRIIVAGRQSQINTIQGIPDTEIFTQAALIIYSSLSGTLD